MPGHIGLFYKRRVGRKMRVSCRMDLIVATDASVSFFGENRFWEIVSFRSSYLCHDRIDSPRIAGALATAFRIHGNISC